MRRRGMVFAMHQIQVACIVRHSRRQRVVRQLPARPGLRAAAHRLGDVGGRDGRRHGPLGRRSSHRRRRALLVREAGADGQLRQSFADDLLTTMRALRGRRRRRPGDRPDAEGPDRSSSRPEPGIRSACAAPARPASSIRAIFPADQILPQPFSTSARRRWCRSPTSSGRISGSASPRMRSTARASSSGTRPGRSRASRSRPRLRGCRT